MNRKQKWLPQAVSLVSSGLVIGTVFAACSSNSSTGNGTSTDGGNDVTSDTGMGGMDAAKDSMMDSKGPDSTTGDSGMDSNADVSSTDGSAPDADAGMGNASLDLCPLLDMAYACGGNANIPQCTAGSGLSAPACGCIDAADGGQAGLIPSERAAQWAFDIQDNFTTNANNDCRTSNLPIDVFGDADGGSAWQNQLVAFAQQLLGCASGDAGSLSYGLLPPEPEQAGQVYTQADLTALNESFVLAIEQALAGTGDAQGFQSAAAPNTMSGGAAYALSSTQLDQLKAALATLQAAVPGVASSTTTYTFGIPADSGTCSVPDGG